MYWFLIVNEASGFVLAIPRSKPLATLRMAGALVSFIIKERNCTIILLSCAAGHHQ